MSKKTKIDTSITWQEITPGGNVYASGNSEEFLTGDWRTKKPILDVEKCIHCLLCIPVCPDSSIPVKDGKRLEFDYPHCKGCGVCAEVCPVDAIKMIDETN